MKAPPRTREIALPAGALRQLRESLRDETDPLTAIHVLHTAGYGSAEEFWSVFSAETEELSDAAFWARLKELFARRGWGRIEHEQLHPGVGAITASEWAESEPGCSSQPACGFSAGLISGILSRAAGAGIAVLETSCRSRGDEVCRFCFGSEDTIHELYGQLLEGHDLDASLERL